MSKQALATEILPAAALRVLQELGANLALARKRRKMGVRDWALRMGVSVPTLARMERGEPSVGMGVYITAMWLVGCHQELSKIVDPKHDMGALEQELQQARRRHQREPKGASNGL